MASLYLLNSPILPSFGNYTFEGPIDIREAKRIVSNGFVSAIGHEGAAVLLSQLLDQPVCMNRIAVHLKPGDQALVLRLGHRLPEGRILTFEELTQATFELGLLTRLA